MASSFDPKAAYSTGLVGCRFDPRAHEVLCDSIMRMGGDPDGGRVALEWGLAEAGKGKLSTPYLAVERLFPGCWPGPAQLTGDCVSKGTRNAVLMSMCCEVVGGLPDEETGRPEGIPELTPAGISNAVIASESLWWWRGYDHDGWSCADAAQVATTRGFLVRKAYPDLKIDLTKYSDSNLRLYGSKQPNSFIAAEAYLHKARTATVLNGREQVRDFLAAGYGVNTCSALGFEDVRNEDGVSRQTTTWQHSQALCGYDDRPETIQKYGQALVLWLNSWGRWNTGPRKIRGTDLLIPEGAYWSLASTIDRCRLIAFSSIAGWPRPKLHTYGARGHI